MDCHRKAGEHIKCNPSLHGGRMVHAKITTTGMERKPLSDVKRIKVEENSPRAGEGSFIGDKNSSCVRCNVRLIVGPQTRKRTLTSLAMQCDTVQRAKTVD
jgi:hypothetical protein